MGKKIYPYASFTTTDIYDRMSKGQYTATKTATEIDCSNISLTGIRNLIGANTTDLGSLCQSSSVNKWSWFGPYDFQVLNSEIAPVLKTPYCTGVFAGYNHNAPQPSIDSHNPDVTTFSNLNELVTVSCYVRLGELDYSFISEYISLKVSQHGETIHQLEDADYVRGYIYISHQFTWSGVANLTAEVWFTNGVVGHGELCKFPGGNNWSFTVKTNLPPSISTIGCGSTFDAATSLVATAEITGSYSSPIVTVRITELIERDSTIDYSGLIKIIVRKSGETDFELASNCVMIPGHILIKYNTLPYQISANETLTIVIEKQ